MVVRILKEEYDKLGDYSMNNDMIKKDNWLCKRCGQAY